MGGGRDAPHATFVRPDLGSFCRLDELGLQVVGQRIEPGRSVLACRVVETGEFARWCRRCGGEAAPRDSVTRRLAHEPLGWRTATLLITIRRYRCTGCGHVWRQDTSRAAGPMRSYSPNGSPDPDPQIPATGQLPGIEPEAGRVIAFPGVHTALVPPGRRPWRTSGHPPQSGQAFETRP